MPHVNCDNVNISVLAKNGRVVDQVLGPIIPKNMIEPFGERVPNSEAYIR